MMTLGNMRENGVRSLATTCGVCQKKGPFGGPVQIGGLQRSLRE